MSDTNHMAAKSDARERGSVSARTGRAGAFTPTQGVVAILLAVTLTFIVVSNYVGWTAKVEVTQVERVCARPDCKQRVFVRGRKQAFSVPADRSVAVGDLAEIRGECKPRCKLDLVSFSNPLEFHRR